MIPKVHFVAVNEAKYKTKYYNVHGIVITNLYSYSQINN